MTTVPVRARENSVILPPNRRTRDLSWHYRRDIQAAECLGVMRQMMMPGLRRSSVTTRVSDSTLPP